MRGKVYWVCQQTFCFQKFVDNTHQCFAFTLQNFPAHNLNFNWRWWDQIQATFKNLLYFKKTAKSLKKSPTFTFKFCDIQNICQGKLQWMFEPAHLSGRKRLRNWNCKRQTFCCRNLILKASVLVDWKFILTVKFKTCILQLNNPLGH